MTIEDINRIGWVNVGYVNSRYIVASLRYACDRLSPSLFAYLFTASVNAPEKK